MPNVLDVALYVCATPIGNQADVSKRLLEVLTQVDFIYCEDTRVTKTLLCQHSYHAKLKTLNNYNEKEQFLAIKHNLEQQKKVALLSDAGTPNISDPGAYVISMLHQEGFRVIPVVGPSSVTALLSICGIRADRYALMGFFPKKKEQFLDLALAGSMPMVFFETPKRILKTLMFLKELKGISQFFIAKELTKLHETHWNSLEAVIEAIKEDVSKQKGEWCFVLTYSPAENSDAGLLGSLIDKGFSRKQLLYLKSIGKLNAERKVIYEHPKFR